MIRMCKKIHNYTRFCVDLIEDILKMFMYIVYLKERKCKKKKTKYMNNRINKLLNKKILENTCLI